MSAESPDRPSPRRRRVFGLLGWALFLLLLAAVGGGGWQLAQVWKAQRAEQHQAIAQLRQQLEAGLGADSAARTKAGKQLDQTRTRLEQLEDHQQKLADRQAQLKTAIDGGAEALRLGAVEQLLAQANDRLLLGRDVATALLALRMADERLAGVGDPRFLPVRKMIAAERTQLESLTLPDVPGLSLRLVTLAQAADSLPLRAPGAHPAVSDAPEVPPEHAAEAGFWQRVWRALSGAFTSVFRVRRVDADLPIVLEPRERLLVRLVLAARLQSAQAALLAGDGEVFRAEVEAARVWLQRYFDAGNHGVQAAAQRLAAMGQIHLNPALPDISESLRLLRKLRRNGA